jgi:ABC-type dipeptide/oligopeptide/nickel transport system permease subunit
VPDDETEAEAQLRRRGPWRQALGRLRRRPLGIAAGLVVVAFMVVALLTPRIAPYSGAQLFYPFINDPQPPAWHGGHLLGTDVIGHDMLTQLLWAVRESVLGGLGCAAGATAIGLVLGGVAGWFGTVLETVIETVTGLIVTVPALAILGLVVVYNHPVPLWAFPATLALCLWVYVARAVQASFRTLREREFVEAAHAAGASGLRIVFRHLLPNTAGTVIVAATAIVGQSIAIIATIQFFGWANEQSDRPTLGGLIVHAVAGMPSGARAPWWIWVFPIATLGLLLVSINFAADAVDEVLEPRHS